MVMAFNESGNAIQFCIVPSASPNGFPVLFAEKKGRGGLCLYVSYHALNANTVRDAGPLPYINGLLSRLKVARVFSSLDVCNSYH